MLQFTLENDSRHNFWGQIDLCPKKYVKLGLEVLKKNEMWRVSQKIEETKISFFTPLIDAKTFSKTFLIVTFFLTTLYFWNIGYFCFKIA